jgi:hypothetical protein
MKLLIVKQACSILTSIQDINNLIYMTYKSYIRSYILKCFYTHHNEKYIPKIDGVFYRITKIYRIDVCGIDCQMCKSNERVHGLLFDTVPYSHPGLCYNCINSL